MISDERREQIREYNRNYCRDYYRKNKVELLRKSKQFRLDNAELVRSSRKRKYWANPERARLKSKEWAEANCDRYLKYQTEYNRRTSKRRIEYRRNRRNTNIGYRIKCALSNRIVTTLRERGLRKRHIRTMEIVGCDIPFLFQHLEKQFQTGMTWENHGSGKGKWHIDHKIPCASFDLSEIEQQRKCFHYSNLQPLWEPDNLAKSSKII